MENMDYENLIFLATLSEKAERYDEMVKYIKMILEHVFDENIPFNLNIRSLFSVAYKNLAGERRASWRILSSERNKNLGYEKETILDDYIVKVETELVDICKEVLDLIDKYILSLDSVRQNVEFKVFFNKMKGDYYRYYAEVATGQVLTDCKTSSLQTYEEALNESIVLPPTNPVRLGLALNFSVFYYEIAKNKDKACILAKQAFDEAISELDQLSEENYKDSTLIMQLLRDNLTLWTAKNENDIEGGEEVPVG